MLSKESILKSEKINLQSEISSVKNYNKELLNIQKENKNEILKIKRDNQSFMDKTKIMDIEIENLKKSLTDQEFDSNYISEELFVKTINDNKDEYLGIFKSKEKELLETLTKLTKKTQDNKDLEIIIEELKNTLEIVKRKSNISVSEEPVLIFANESNNKLIPKGVKKSCPFPSCNGEGNRRSGFRTHTTISNCPMAKLQNPQKSTDHNINKSHKPLLKDVKMLSVKLKSYRVIKSKTPLKNGCTFPSCYGKGNTRSGFNTHNTIKNCPMANLQKPHSTDELIESINANNLFLKREKILLKNEIQSLQEKLNNYKVTRIKKNFF